MTPIILLVIIIFIAFGLLYYFLSPKSDLTFLGSDTFDINTYTSFSAPKLDSTSWTLSFFIHPIPKNQVIEDYIPIVNNGGSIQLKLSGITSSSKPDSSSVQLQVGDTSFPIQSLPYQKWTYVSITRDSLRLTIYYNGKAVFSKFLDTIPSSSALSLGNSSAYVAGKFANVSTDGLRNKREILQQYNSLTDTTGRPNSATPYSIPSPTQLFTTDYSFSIFPKYIMEASAPPPGSRWNVPYS